MLIRLIYASKATEPVKPETIRSILSSARANNALKGVTGMLCHGQDRFLQILEGDREAVDAVYSNITQDKRHAGLVLLAYKDVTERIFKSWNMDYVSADDPETAKLIKSITGREEFAPKMFSSSEAIDLAQGLARRAGPQITLE